MSTLRPQVIRLRRLFLRYRRIISAVLAAAAAVAAVEAVSPQPPASSPVVVAAHDLIGGSPIGPEDVRVAFYDPKLVPAGASRAVSDVVGATVAAPMSTGEPLTDHRLLSEALLAGYDSGLVAAPVRIYDAGVVALLSVGQRIDVYAADGDRSAGADVVVAAAEIAALPPVPDDRSTDGALVVLVVDTPHAAALAQAAATTQLSVALRG